LQYKDKPEPLTPNLKAHAAGSPPRARNNTLVNPATTGSLNPGGNVVIANITPYCIDLNVHIRSHT